MNHGSDSQKRLEEDNFGTWMLVRKAGRKPKQLTTPGVDKTIPSAVTNPERIKRSRQTAQVTDQNNPQLNDDSRFTLLQYLEEEAHMGGMANREAPQEPVRPSLVEQHTGREDATMESDENNENIDNDFPTKELHLMGNDEDEMQSLENVPETSLTPWSASKINLMAASRGEGGQRKTKVTKKTSQDANGPRGLGDFRMGQGPPAVQVRGLSKEQARTLPVRKDNLRGVTLPQA